MRLTGMPRFLMAFMSIVSAALLMAAGASCSRQAEYETVLRLNGVSGQTVSDTFTISGRGQAELMLLNDPPTTGLDISLYQADDDDEPLMQATWVLAGDSFDDIPPGQYYLNAYIEDIAVPATIANPGFYIEVRDYTD